MHAYIGKMDVAPSQSIAYNLEMVKHTQSTHYSHYNLNSSSNRLCKHMSAYHTAQNLKPVSRLDHDQYLPSMWISMLTSGRRSPCMPHM